MSVIARRIPRNYGQLAALRPSRTARARLVLLLVVVAAFPFFASSLYVSIALATLIAIPGALALNMLSGVAGLISIGNAGFMAVGAGAAAEFGARMGLPFPAAVLLGGCVAALSGMLVGIPSLRLRGVYLLVSTFAFHYLATFGFQEFQAHTVGDAGFTMPVPSLFGAQINSSTSWYFTLVIVAVILLWGYANLMRSRVGRAWLLMRERELAAEVLGINVSRTKITVFVASAFVIGIQGALYAYYVQVITYDQFSLNLAISYWAMILIGGMASPTGAVYGALFVSALPFILQQISLNVAASSSWLQQNITNIENLVYGGAIVLFLLFEPQGLVAITGRIRVWFENWPFGRTRELEAREW